ncbi:hypothetical protein MUP77_11985 [Candidatus Bathyarchaeota archaeon]|nr:hypothetical protein [Candidatus Bathyarchaeota archaeon]
MTKRIVLEISEDLHKQFKAFCADNGTTITEEIKSFICGLLESKAEMEKEAQTEDNNEIPLKAEKIEKSFDIDAFRKGLDLKPKKEEVKQDFSLDSIFD